MGLLYWFGFSTFRIRSWSSTTPSSLPIACAIRFPATKLPTTIEAGPTSTGQITNNQTNLYNDKLLTIKQKQKSNSVNSFIVKLITGSSEKVSTCCDVVYWASVETVYSGLPGSFCRGLGMLVTQVCGHMRILQGCRFPSKKFCLVSQMWMPPRGVFGRVLAGTSARQYRPTWWILSMACTEIMQHDCECKINTIKIFPY